MADISNWSPNPVWDIIHWLKSDCVNTHIMLKTQACYSVSLSLGFRAHYPVIPYLASCLLYLPAERSSIRTWFPNILYNKKCVRADMGSVLGLIYLKCNININIFIYLHLKKLDFQEILLSSFVFHHQKGNIGRFPADKPTCCFCVSITGFVWQCHITTVTLTSCFVQSTLCSFTQHTNQHSFNLNQLIT